MVRVGEVYPLTDEADREAAHTPALADARIEHGRLAPRIGPDDQQGVSALDAGNGGVEQIARPAKPGIERRAVLSAIEARNPEARHQILEGEDLFAGSEIA